MNKSFLPPSLKNGMITMAHGGGGKAMRELIDYVFVSQFHDVEMEDQARLFDEGLREKGSRLGFTTDGFVVNPLEFPGGDIGKIAICGTVNDLAVGGAKPLWISVSFIIEEGFSLERLQNIVQSMKITADEAHVKIVTGDTKIVEKGSADGIYITTSGVGVIPAARDLSPQKIQEGDLVIVNGELGDHAAAIMAARGEMALSAQIESDCAPLNGLIESLLAVSPNIRMMRDATRGGIASTLNEMAQESALGVEIVEADLPLSQKVRGVCEILGLDPLYMANEGRIVVIAPAEEAQEVLKAMQVHKYGQGAVIIGKIVNSHQKRVVMKTIFGGNRLVDMLVGDQLPRIC